MEGGINVFLFLCVAFFIPVTSAPPVIFDLRLVSNTRWLCGDKRLMGLKRIPL